MKVKFLRDYRGRETGENFVREGESWDIEPKEIRHLVNEEVIEKQALQGLPLFDDVPVKALTAKKKAAAKAAEKAGSGVPAVVEVSAAGDESPSIPLHDPEQEQSGAGGGQSEDAPVEEAPAEEPAE